MQGVRNCHTSLFWLCNTTIMNSRKGRKLNYYHMSSLGKFLRRQIPAAHIITPAKKCCVDYTHMPTLHVYESWDLALWNYFVIPWGFEVRLKLNGFCLGKALQSLRCYAS